MCDRARHEAAGGAIAFEKNRRWLDGTPLVRPEPGSRKSKQAFNTDVTEKQVKPRIYTENVKLFL